MARGPIESKLCSGCSKCDLCDIQKDIYDLEVLLRKLSYDACKLDKNLYVYFYLIYMRLPYVIRVKNTRYNRT